MRLPAQENRAPDDRRITVKIAPPESFAQNHRLRTAFAIFVLIELASHLRRDAEHPEKPVRNSLLLYIHAVALDAEIHAADPIRIHRCVDRRCAIADHLPGLTIMAVVDLVAFMSVKRRDYLSQSIGLGERERANHRGVNHGQNRGIRADAQRENHDHCQRKCPILAEQPERET